MVNTWFVDSPVQSLSALNQSNPTLIPNNYDSNSNSISEVKPDPYPCSMLEQSLTITEIQSELVSIKRETTSSYENETKEEEKEKETPSVPFTLPPPLTLNPDLDRAADFIRDATAVLIVAGAGIPPSLLYPISKHMYFLCSKYSYLI